MLKDDRGAIRVVVVDDSPTVRSLLTAILSDAGLQVVGCAANGEEALRLISRLRPDVVTMDVHMPGMDGLEATRRIMRQAPTPIVIVAESMMRSDMDLTFESLKVGALTVVRKPDLHDPDTCAQVAQTIRLMAGVPVVHHWGKTQDTGRKASGSNLRSEVPALRAGASVQKLKSDIKIVGIAASTGGPAALAAVLGALAPDFPLPILVVQHVTNGFALGLAEWLSTQTPLAVSLAGHGETPQPGTVLIAPDDYHLRVNLYGGVELSRESPYRGLRPSANYLFASLAQVYGDRSLGIILTGMGDDGAEGLEALHLSGGLTLAQDEASCVVYGMPREAVVRNAVDRVLAPDQIALALGQLARQTR